MIIFDTEKLPQWCRGFLSCLHSGFSINILQKHVISVKAKKLIIATQVLTKLQALFGFFHFSTNTLFLFQDPTQHTTLHCISLYFHVFSPSVSLMYFALIFPSSDCIFFFLFSFFFPFLPPCFYLI